MGRGSEPAELIGTRSADRIRASGHARRVEQAGHMSAPDRADLSERNPLRDGGRPHMTPLNRTRDGLGQNGASRAASEEQRERFPASRARGERGRMPYGATWAAFTRY